MNDYIETLVMNVDSCSFKESPHKIAANSKKDLLYKGGAWQTPPSSSGQN